MFQIPIHTPKNTCFPIPRRLRRRLTIGAVAMALVWVALVSISAAAPVAFFDSAEALQKHSAAAVLQQAKARVTKARKDRTDFARALGALGLLELDFGHVTKAYGALEEARQLLERNPAVPAQVLGAVWVGLAWTFQQGLEHGLEYSSGGSRREFAGWRLTSDEWDAKIVMTARHGLKLLDASGYGSSAEAYRARILLFLKDRDAKGTLAHAASLREEMARAVPGQHRLFIDLLHVEVARGQYLPAERVVEAANEALTLARKAFGEQHPLTAKAYEMQSPNTADEPVFNRTMLKALSIWENIDTREGLVDRYFHVGRAALNISLSACSTYFDKAIAQAQKVYGASSVQLLQVYGAIVSQPFTCNFESLYTEVMLRRAIAIVERTKGVPPGLQRVLYTALSESLSSRSPGEERNTVRAKRITALMRDQDALDRKISALPPSDPEEIAEQAEEEENPTLYKLALDIWAADKPPRSGLVEAMATLTTNALKQGKTATALPLLERASTFVSNEEEPVTRAFLHLAKAACLRAQAADAKVVEQEMRTGFAALAKGAAQDTYLDIATGVLRKHLFGWFVPPSPKDTLIVAAFALASSAPIGGDMAALATAFRDLLAASTVGWHEAALAFIEHVTDPADYAQAVEGGAVRLGLREGDAFVDAALSRAELLHGQSHPQYFTVLLAAVLRYLDLTVIPLTYKPEPGELETREDKGLHALAVAEELAVALPTIDAPNILGLIDDLGDVIEGEVGSRLRNLSKRYGGEQFGVAAKGRALQERRAAQRQRKEALSSDEVSLSEVLDGFLALRPRALTAADITRGPWASRAADSVREQRRVNTLTEAVMAAEQPGRLATALQSARDAVRLAEEQFQAELAEAVLNVQRAFDRHASRRDYYLFALNLLHRVQQEAPEFRDKVVEVAVPLAQRALRSRVGHAAKTRGNSELLALQHQEAALRNELSDLSAAIHEAVGAGRGEDMVTKNLKDRLEAIWIALKEMEKTSAPARSAFITGMMESPLPLREIQEVLAPDEAVLVYVMDDDSRRETLIKSHVVVIRRDGAALVTLPHFGLFIHDADVSDLLKSHLWGPTEAMQILHTAMQHQASVNRGLHQADVDTPTVSPLPSAHRLYRQVVEPVRSELEGVHHLIVMADGYLGGVPFSLLVMTRPGTDADQDFTKVDWLLNRFETSYVPSLNSLVALRRETASRPAAPKAFIGFGDPIFRSSAGKTALAPLPETRDELQQIAAALLAEPDSLHFGQFATEEAVRTVGLDQYRVVAFATHGLLADGDSNIDEPALALTPGQEQGRGEDGLLSATEIATLKLNADLVLLSACNTAGVADTPQAKYRENVAGLTLPFFHAGARALLVSHWPVDSEATVLLTTRMIATGSQSNVRKSAALAEAMRRMAKGSMGARYVHPYYWAPFVIVGDGGPARR